MSLIRSSIGGVLYTVADQSLQTIPGLRRFSQWILSPVDPTFTAEELNSYRTQAMEAVNCSDGNPGLAVTTTTTTTTELNDLGHLGWNFDTTTNKDDEKNKWVAQPNGSTSTPNNLNDKSTRGDGSYNNNNNNKSTLTVLTYNIMMDEYNKYIPGVIHSNVRYREILRRIFADSTSLIDCICFNEVDRTFLRLLSDHPTVRSHYVMTDYCSDSNNNNNNDDDDDPTTFDRNSHGVVVLVRKSESTTIQSIHSFRSKLILSKTKSKWSRASIIVRLQISRKDHQESINNYDSGSILTVVATHLESCNKRFRQRCQHLLDLYRLLSCSSSSSSSSDSSSNNSTMIGHGPNMDEKGQVLILGDFNFHQEAESCVIVPPYVDLWTYLLHPSGDQQQEEEEGGYTWDSKRNKLIQRFLLGVDVRRMRLDRVILTLLPHHHSNEKDENSRSIHVLLGPLEPIDIRLFGTQSFHIPLMGDVVQEFHPSDHFGLLCEFNVNK